MQANTSSLCCSDLFQGGTGESDGEMSKYEFVLIREFVSENLKLVQDGTSTMLYSVPLYSPWKCFKPIDFG